MSKLYIPVGISGTDKNDLLKYLKEKNDSLEKASIDLADKEHAPEIIRSVESFLQEGKDVFLAPKINRPFKIWMSLFHPDEFKFVILSDSFHRNLCVKKSGKTDEEIEKEYIEFCDIVDTIQEYDAEDDVEFLSWNNRSLIEY